MNTLAVDASEIDMRAYDVFLLIHALPIFVDLSGVRFIFQHCSLRHAYVLSSMEPWQQYAMSVFGSAKDSCVTLDVSLFHQKMFIDIRR